MKSARRRFSASGICLAIMAASFASVMPGRAAIRAFCTSSGAVTSSTASTSALAAGLKQERDVENDKIGARGARLGDKFGARGAHQRMDDRLKPRHRRRVIDHIGREARPVDLAITQRARKGRLDQRRGRAAIERMHGGIRNHARERRLRGKSPRSPICPCRSSR